MEMRAIRQRRFTHLRRGKLRACAIGNVEDEIARTIFLVSDKSASGDRLLHHADTSHIDAIAGQTIYIEPTEIVVADTSDDAARLTEFCHLVDENGGCSAWVRPDEDTGPEQALAGFGSHDFDQNLTDGHHFFQGYAFTSFDRV